MSHPSQRSRDQIHNAAEEIWYCCYGKDLKSALDHLSVSRIDLQDLGTEHIGSHAEHHRYSYRKDHTVHKNTVHPFWLADTVVLAGKAHTRLGDRIYGSVQKSHYIIGRRIARHGCGAEGIYGRLQHGVAEINNRALDTRRYSHLKDTFQINAFDRQSGKTQLIAALCFAQTSDDQNTGDHLRSHGTDSHAGHAQRNNDDKRQIQHHVRHPGNRQKHQRTLGIPHRPQNCGAIVVEHKERHSHEINPHIQHRLIDHIRRGIHHFQRQPGRSHSHESHDHAAHQRQRYGRMYRL